MTSPRTSTGYVIPEFSRGDRFRKAREVAGYSSQQFANLIGVSRNTIGNVEADRVEVRAIVVNAWALATGVPKEWLMTGNYSHSKYNAGNLAAVIPIRSA